MPFFSRIIALALVLLAGPGLYTQTPVPAPAQNAPVLIFGATAHLGDGTVVPNAVIAFENGKLTIVSEGSTIRLDRSRFSKIFDATGKHVYPGFIATDTRLGLVELDAVRSTQDYADAGSFNPNLRALVAYNSDSEIIPTVRGNGVLLAQITPVGGTLSGFSSVVQLDAWNWEDAAYRADDGLHLYWPGRRGGGNDAEAAKKRDEQHDKDIQSLQRFFGEARAYFQNPAPAEHNLKFESMRGLFDRKQNLYLHTGLAQGIQEAVLFAEQFQLKPVLVGGEDAWLVADFLKTHNVPVIFAKTQRLPAREDESVDQPYRTPAVLHEKGVLFAFQEEGSWRNRNLPFQAGQAVGYGLPYEAAVSALTLNTARILGIDATTGSLQVGKDATLFVSDGDALDMRTCKVTAAFIQGREISLDDKQKELYRKFGEKYKRAGQR